MRESPHSTLTNLQSPKGKKAGPPPSDHGLLGGLPPHTHVKQILLGTVLWLQGLWGIQTLRVDVQVVLVVPGAPGVGLHVAVPWWAWGAQEEWRGQLGEPRRGEQEEPHREPHPHLPPARKR